MTDITELAKKHKVLLYREWQEINTIVMQDTLVMTPAQLRAIIKAESAPLVYELMDIETQGMCHWSRKKAEKVVAEFNKEFGDG